jgi:hypothetical protein
MVVLPAPLGAVRTTTFWSGMVFGLKVERWKVEGFVPIYSLR